MSTEQKSPPQPTPPPQPQLAAELETNALAARLMRGWAQFKRGELVSFRLMAVLLVAVTGLGLWLYIRTEKAATASRAWVELDGASTDAALRRVAADFKGTPAGRVAELHLARALLGPEGIDKLLNREPADRKKAVANVEEARDVLARLADEFAGKPVLRAECYLGLAKAEMALTGVPKEGKLDEFRGSVETLLGYLDQLAAEADGTPWGDEAKKLAEALRKPDGKARDELRSVQRNLYGSSLAAPALPGGGPLAPGGPGLGGLPGFGGLPGGDPLFPPAAPPTTAPSVGPTPTPAVAPAPPVGTAPIPPATAPLTPGGQPSNPTPPEPKKN